MAIEAIKQQLVGITASADLSTKQFRFVEMTGDFTVQTCNNATDIPIGVLDNAPKSGQEAVITSFGMQKVLLGGTVTAGQRVGSDANGAGVAYVEGTDTTKYIAGFAVNGGVAGEIITVMLSGTPHRAA